MWQRCVDQALPAVLCLLLDIGPDLLTWAVALVFVVAIAALVASYYWWDWFFDVPEPDKASHE